MFRRQIQSGAQAVSESISPTHEYLLNRYGPLLTAEHVAEILHMTPDSVRTAVARRNQPLSLALSLARRRLGRRVYFEARRIAEAIDREPPGIPPLDRPSEATGSKRLRSSLSLGHGLPPKFP